MLKQLNPARWPAPHKLALIVAMIVGAVFGLLFGLNEVGNFLHYQVAGRENIYWLAIGGWTVLGAVISGAMVYVARLLKTPL